MNTLALILLIIGIALIVIEIVVPGFGVIGIGGIACVIGSIIIFSTSIKQALLLIVVALVVIIALFVASTLLFNKKSKVVLKAEEKPEEGYIAVKIDKQLIGKQGVAETDLHPSGAIRIDGQKYSAMSDGSYIIKGEKIKVIDVRGGNIIVIKED